MSINRSKIESELKFKTSRSGGKGGQHVNKVESRVELYFDIKLSLSLSEVQKQLLLDRLRNKLIGGTILRIVADEQRSQQKNKKIAIDKLFLLLRNALKRKKKRIPMKPSKASKEKRINVKKRKSEVKKLRRRVDL